MGYASSAAARALLIGLAMAPAGRVLAGPKDGDPASPTVLDLGGESLRLADPDLPGLERRDDGDDQLKAWWTGTVDSSEVLIELRVFANGDGRLNSPQAVSAYVADVLRDPEYKGDPDFAFAKVEIVKGKFGPSSFATLSTGPIPSAKNAHGEIMVLGGVLAVHAYTVRARANPALEGASRDKLLAFLRQGVSATYPVLDPKWSADEVKKRWEQSVDDPKVRAALRPVVRTKHYLIFTDSAAGPLFAKKMETCYEQIQKTYPFDEVDGARLLPVFLFKDDAEYVLFSVKGSAMSQKEAQGTKGHAWHDFYATYYDSPNDPVHIHEATHQLFMNRLHLTGGGSWFQEGLAEYMCTLPGDRKGFARNAARSGKFSPFRDLVRSRDIIAGVGGIEGGPAYTQAASIIEFLRDGKFHPDKFQTFVHEIGSVTGGDETAIDTKIKEIYGVDLDGLEKEWVKYWTAK